MNAIKSLELEVHATNELRRLAINEIANVLPQLQKYIGKKIFTLKGKAKSFEINLLNEVPKAFDNGHASNHMNYITHEYGKLVLRFKLCFNGGSYDVSPSTAYTKYIDHTIELGVIQNGEILTELHTSEKTILMHGLERVIDFKTELDLIHVYNALQANADKAKSLITVGRDYYRYIN